MAVIPSKKAAQMEEGGGAGNYQHPLFITRTKSDFEFPANPNDHTE